MASYRTLLLIIRNKSQREKYIFREENNYEIYDNGSEEGHLSWQLWKTTFEHLY